jgi:dihydrodipicolinate synthase/N-acetylneuraminate lyase
LKERFKGVIAATVTPFNEDFEVDYEGVKKNVEFLIEKV